MNYKVACDLYRSRYQRQAIKRKEPVPRMSDAEILLELSIAQKELSETFRLSRKTQTLDLVANQYKYTVGVGSSNIKADILDIKNIIVSPVLRETVVTQIITQGDEEGYGEGYGEVYGGGTSEIITNVTSYVDSGTNGVLGYPKFLTKASLGDIGNVQRLAGLPTRYAFHDADDDSVLWIDSLPNDYSADKTSRLFIIYNQKMYLFFDDPDNNNTTWSDYDESESDYGGSFKLPNQFHSLIVEGALATAFPELYKNYIAKANSMVRTKPVSVSGKLQYSLGGI